MAPSASSLIPSKDDEVRNRQDAHDVDLVKQKVDRNTAESKSETPTTTLTRADRPVIHIPHHTEHFPLLMYQNIARDGYKPALHLGMKLFDAVCLPERFFVGRESELEELRGLLIDASDGIKARKQVGALCGIGGMGKTQLALRFARLHQHVFHSTIFLNASSESGLRRSLADLHVLIEKTSGEQTTFLDEEEHVQRALRWLSLPANFGYLLVMDNYDDPSGISGFKSASGFDIHNYFPPISQGAIIITSRANLVDHFETLSPRLAGPDEAFQIMRRRAGRNEISSGKEDAAELLNRLDGLPLALATAGAYLRQVPGMPYKKYLEFYDDDYKGLDQGQEPLPDYSAVRQKNPSDRVLFRTWEISYQHILKERPIAAQLLSFLPILDPRGIQLELFQTRDSSDPDWFQALSEAAHGFRQAFKTLSDYSFIGIDENGGAYSIHQCLHHWLVIQAQPEMKSLKFHTFIWGLLDRSYTQRTACESIWKVAVQIEPHAKQALKLLRPPLGALDSRKLPSRTLEAIHRVLAIVAEIDTHSGLQQWESFYTAIGSRLDPKYSRSGLKVLFRRGFIISLRDRHHEAEKLLQKAFRRLLKRFGPLDPRTFEAVRVLGVCYEQQNKWREADALYKLVSIATYRSAWRRRHRQPRQEAFKPVSCVKPDNFLREFRRLLKRFGLLEPRTLRAIRASHSYFKQENKWKEADAIYKLTSIKLNRLADDSQYLTIARGLCYLVQPARHRAGEILLDRIRKLCKANMVEFGPATLLGLRQLGQAMVFEPRRKADARYYLELAVRVCGVIHGPNSQQAQSFKLSLGLFYLDRLSHRQKAEDIFREVAKFNKQSRTPDHEATLNARFHLARAIAASQGKEEQRAELIRDQLQHQERILGNGHQQTQATRILLSLLDVLKDPRGAEALARKTIESAEGEGDSGRDHPLTIYARYALANAIDFNIKGRDEERAEAWRTVLQCYERTGFRDLNFRTAKVQLGHCYLRLSRRQEAIDLFTAAAKPQLWMLGSSLISSCAMVFLAMVNQGDGSTKSETLTESLEDVFLEYRNLGKGYSSMGWSLETWRLEAVQSTVAQYLDEQSTYDKAAGYFKCATRAVGIDKIRGSLQ